MDSKPNGFTLIETVVALSIFLLLASFSPLLIKVLSPPAENRVPAEELESFYLSIGPLIREASQVTATGDRLNLTSDSGQQVTFSFYENKIRKQVNGQGHEIWLFSVKQFRPIITDSSVTLVITDIASHVYKRVFVRKTGISP
ncbi:competence type IV pilus minor pilin ComGF [Fictibacillus fluitans]|uniref:Competence type IV pilus minor pilin ComGF n=1 Tax=Fictibacillus fluitans TaxID=3058422 RepID=A0ABT8HYH0_9BACL|nr:competence type IV pilus minor pilin ComGF [Fictibacillus sp. NE201]MDN4525302.1 competence type IV pilus minor pilin ComGF [Fictibacillus sp. NE201]